MLTTGTAETETEIDTATDTRRTETAAIGNDTQTAGIAETVTDTKTATVEGTAEEAEPHPLCPTEIAMLRGEGAQVLTAETGTEPGHRPHHPLLPRWRIRGNYEEMEDMLIKTRNETHLILLA